MRDFAPPFLTSDTLSECLRKRGFVVLRREWTERASGLDGAALDIVARTWNDLPPDPYLKDGGHYRGRRHSSFVVEGPHCRAVPHRPHFQSPDYNALHGGMQRWFEPMAPGVAALPGFAALVVSLAEL